MITQKTPNLILIPQFIFDVNNKKIIFQIFKILTKKGYVIKNYQPCLKLKVFKFENDIRLLIINYIFFFKNGV